MCAIVPRYLECVIQCDSYSSCVKIRCPGTDSGDCKKLRTLAFAAVNCKVRILAIELYYLSLRVVPSGVYKVSINPIIQSIPRL
jgi:hypothetical protein